ncbi:MAG: clostripain-related cysteine peptidase [Caldilineaceae bacterium]
MKHTLLRRWLVLLMGSLATSLCLLLFGDTLLHVQAAPHHAATTTTLAAIPGGQTDIAPLPGGCIGGVPAGEDPPICCMSGLVFVNGQPVSGAEVSISDAQGVVAQVQTYLHKEADTQPYYQVDLTHLTRPVTVSQEITIVARYSGLTSQLLHHTVQRGGQALNLIINQPGALAAAGGTTGQAPLGRISRAWSVATDSPGNIYVADFENARIQKFSPDGAPLRAWGKQGTLPEQFSQVAGGVAVDQHNNIVYVADRVNQRINRYTLAGDLIDSWQPPPARPQAFSYFLDLTVAPNGEVYVLALNGGLFKFSANGVWQPWQPDTNVTWSAGGALALSPDEKVYATSPSDNGIYRFDNGQPISLTVSFNNGSVYGPGGITFDATGKLYVMFYQQGTGAPHLLRFTVQGNTVVQDAAWQWQPPATLGHARGVTIHNNDLYVAGDLDNYVYHFHLDGSYVGKIGSDAPNPGQMINPLSVAVSPMDNSAYVADLQSQQILQLNPAADVVSASWDLAAVTQSITKPALLPYGLAFDHTGHLFMVDKYSTLNRFTRDAQGLHLDGMWGGPDQFTAPYALAIDRNDNIYVADQQNNRVKIVKITDTGLQTVTMFSNVTATDTLRLPQSIAIDDRDAPTMTVGYVVDAHACNTPGVQRLFKFTFAQNAIQTVTPWGTNGWGDATLPQVCPTAVDVDAAGNLYLLDQGHIIRKFDTTGHLLATAGFAGSVGAGPDQLSGATDLAVAKDGTVYVTDPSNLRVQRFQPITVGDPVASIVQVSTDTVAAGTPFIVVATGQTGADQRQITGYEWSTDDGFKFPLTANPIISIQTALTPTVEQLGPGSHHLRLRVQDSQGAWSAYTSITIKVRAVPAQPLPQCPAGQSWTFLLYLDADNTKDGAHLASVYDQSIARLAGSPNPCVQLAIQRDNPPGVGEPGTERWLRVAGQPLSQQRNITEARMDISETLISFINWGQKAAPADHYYLAIADHGNGAQGIAWDYTSDPGGDAYLTPAELRAALAAPGISPIDVLHLDACSMGLFEVAYELRNHVNYVVASQYLGWDFFLYDQYAQLAPSTPAQLARGIVQRYAARAQHAQLPYTLAAWDLSRIDPLYNGLSRLADMLNSHLTDNIDQARRLALLAVRKASQTFDSDRDSVNMPADAYVDLRDWLTHLRDANINDTITLSATSIINELQRPDGVILTQSASRTPLPLDIAHGAVITLTYATGMSVIYPIEGEFHMPPPNSAVAATSGYTYTQLYVDYVGDKVFDFPQTSHWGDFLKAAYGVPAAGAPVEPPGPPPAPLVGPQLPPPQQYVYLPLIQR